MILDQTKRFYVRLHLALSYREQADRQAGFRSTDPRLPTLSLRVCVAVTQIKVQRNLNVAFGTDVIVLVPLHSFAAAPGPHLLCACAEARQRGACVTFTPALCIGQVSRYVSNEGQTVLLLHDSRIKMLYVCRCMSVSDEIILQQ